MRVLIITPSFFGYEKAIAEAFRAANVEVDLLDERPSNSALGRGLLRVAPMLMARQLRRHYERAMDLVRSRSYDGLLVIKGEVLPKWFLAAFCDAQPDCRRVFYTFDAISNSSHCVGLFDQFHKLYSFDPVDAQTFSLLEYKPLFYADEYVYSADPRDIDLAFIGTLHGPRYAFTQAVSSGASPSSRVVMHYYVQAMWFYWASRLLDRGVRRVPRAAVTAHKLSRSAVADITRRSRAVIDVQRTGQAGLTMRTFEVLASGSALITGNRHLAEEPFYDPRVMLIVPSSARTSVTVTK